ncbi:MAG TPA: hypothetical protein VL693_20290 [Vicinamibacterales bacterium]|nr:hypothetical protein [Vicinamibacterales bacterium]
MFTTLRRLLLVIGLALLTASPSRGEVGILVLEPVDALGFFTRVGHAGTYFSNICPDGSPVKMRLCHPGEHGGVVSKYAPLSEHENYDWAIVPFEAFMHGFVAPELAPVIGTPGLQRAIEQFEFAPLFSSALAADGDGQLPEGQWKAALATRFDRTIYLYSVETTEADDAALVAAFNAAPNKSRFNFFYRNCSDQARRIFDLILPNIEMIGDRTGGVTMQTPKGLAKALVARALKYPELHLQVRRYPQLPGTFGRSTDVLFPMENTYKSVALMPWWLFGGFREVALGSMFYHEVVSPFGMLESSRDFMSPRAAELTLEQWQLRRQQDEIRLALAVAVSRGSGWSTLSTINASVSRRLSEIGGEKRAEVTRIEGSTARWQELGQEFQALIRPLGEWTDAPDVLKKRLAVYEPDGTLAKQLVEYFDANGQFFVAIDGRGPWISLPLADGELASTGLSMSHILSGDPRLAALVLAAVIDYNLAQSPARREDIESVERIFTLFRQVIDRLDVKPTGE